MPCLGVRWIECDGLRVRHLGFGLSALPIIQRSEVVPDVPGVGLEFQGLLKRCFRIGDPLLLLVRGSEPVPGLRVVWYEADGFLESILCLVISARLQARVA